jgi:hypothetical protein
MPRAIGPIAPLNPSIPTCSAIVVLSAALNAALPTIFVPVITPAVPAPPAAAPTNKPGASLPISGTPGKGVPKTAWFLAIAALFCAI